MDALSGLIVVLNMLTVFLKRIMKNLMIKKGIYYLYVGKWKWTDLITLKLNFA